MGGKDDDDARDEIDKFVLARAREFSQLMRRLEDSVDSDLRSRSDDAAASPSSSSRKGPFERFKSFVDSNLGTFSHGFRNFSANVAELKAAMQQERQATQREEADIWRAWTGSDDTPDHIRMQVERQRGEEREEVKEMTYMLLREAYERNKHVPPSKILALYRDTEAKFGSLDRFATPMLSMGGACYYKTETVENLPSTARWKWSSAYDRIPWLSVEWFKRHPYSPIRLERRPELEDSGINWRAAFEDLLCAALDKPVVSEEKVGQRMPYGRPQSTYRGPGLEWMLSLQCRGILPPQLPSLYKPVPLFDGFDEVKRPRIVEFMHDLDQITANHKSARMYPGVKSDLNVLMDEIAIKSGPETEAKPLKIVQSPWRVPETEQELYEAMPPYTDLASEPQAPPPAVLAAVEDLTVHIDGVDAAAAANDYETFKTRLDASQAAHNKIFGGEKAYQTEAEVRQFFEMLRRREAASPPVDLFQQPTPQALPPPPPVLALLDGELKMLSSIPSLLKAVEARDFDGFQKAFAAVRREDRRNILAALPEFNERALFEELSRIPAAALSPLISVYENLAPPPSPSPLPSAAPRLESGSKSGQRPDILSQLTTTHTTRKPDGTVVTKVVLKQSFADGTEETHENVQTIQGEPPSSAAAKGEYSREQQQQPKKKSGWFWN